MLRQIAFWIMGVGVLLTGVRCQVDPPSGPEEALRPTKNHRPEHTPSKGETPENVLSYPIEFTPGKEHVYLARKNGQLLAGEVPLVVGQKIERDQFLFHIDKTALFQQLKQLKTALKTRLNRSATPPGLFAEKWYVFADSISVQDLLPPPPSITTDAEREWLERLNISSLLQEVIHRERELQQFYQLATEKGTIHKVFRTAGTPVTAGDSILSVQISAGKYGFQSPHKIRSGTPIVARDKTGKHRTQLQWKLSKNEGNYFRYTLRMPSNSSVNYTQVEVRISGE